MADLDVTVAGSISVSGTWARPITVVPSDYADYVVGLGPLAYYRLNDRPNYKRNGALLAWDTSHPVKVVDSSGNQRHGSITPTFGWNDGGSNADLGSGSLLYPYFDNNEALRVNLDSVVVPYASWMDGLSSAFSFVVHVIPGPADGFFWNLAGRGAGSGSTADTEEVFTFSTSSNPAYSSRVKNQAGALVQHSLPSTGTRKTMWTVTYDGTTVRTYLDTTLVGSTALAPPLKTSARDFKLGGGGGGMIYDEAALFGRALSPTEIAQMWRLANLNYLQPEAKTRVDSAVTVDLATQLVQVPFGRIARPTLTAEIATSLEVTASSSIGVNAAVALDVEVPSTVQTYPTVVLADNPVGYWRLGDVSYRKEVLADGPVVYFPLDESSGTTMVDASGNGHDGAYINNPTLQAGGVLGGGKAVRFERSRGQYATFPTTDLPNGDDPYTLEIWCNTPVPADNLAGLLSIGHFASTNEANALRLNGNPGITNYWWSNDFATDTPGLTANRWHHVVATWDGTTHSIYLDGALVGSRTPEPPNVVADVPTVGLTLVNEFFDGYLDEVAVYAKCLPSTRVAAHHAAAVNPLSTMLDSSGHGHDGLYSGDVTPAASLLGGDPDAAARFNGGAGGTPGSPFNHGSAFSVEALFKPQSIGGNQTVVCRHSSGGSSPFIVRLQDQWLYFYAKFDGDYVAAVSSVPVGLNTRHHVICTYDNAVLRIYLDGALVGTTNRTGPANEGPDQFDIGSSHTGGGGGQTESFVGVIDEVSFYDHTLPPIRVAAHYAAANGAPLTPYATGVLNDGAVAYWRLGEQSGTTMLDTSGYGRHGTYEGSPVLGADGLLVDDPDTAVSFTGDNGCIGRVPFANWMQVADLTAEFVFSPTDLAGQNTLLTRANFNSGYGPSYVWMLYSVGTVLQAVVFSNDTNVAATLTSEAGLLAVGETYHVALTYDSTAETVVLYVNGQSIEATTLAAPMSPGSTSVGIVVAGDWNYNSGGQNFTGRMDEVAFYATALSATTVLDHYNAMRAVTPPPAEVITGGEAREDNLAFAGTVLVTIPGVVVGGTATEAGTARRGTWTVAVPAGRATEGDTARKGLPVTLVLAGRSVEVETATSGQTLANLGAGRAMEVSAARRGLFGVGIVSGRANENESVQHGRARGSDITTGVGVVRWVLTDPSTSETWVFPRNPNKMTSPHAPKATTIFARNTNFEDTKLGVGRVLQFRQNPYEWSFSGDIRTQEQYDEFRDWVCRVGRLRVRDHLMRTWEIRFDSVEVDEKKRTANNPWRFTYTAKAIIYGRIS